MLDPPDRVETGGNGVTGEICLALGDIPGLFRLQLTASGIGRGASGLEGLEWPWVVFVAFSGFNLPHRASGVEHRDRRD